MRRLIIYGLLVLLALVVGYQINEFGFWWSGPAVKTFSGPINNGINAYATYGMYGRTIDFSPDEKSLAYIWSDKTYKRTRESEGRPLTLTELLEVRVRSTGADRSELRIPLDSVDFRPKGEIYYSLDANLQMAPDSKHLAVLCARRLVLVDLETGTNRRIEYAGEFFGTFSWQDAITLNFSTYGRERGTTFWQWKLGSPIANRAKVHDEPIGSPNAGLDFARRPPKLWHNQWSPNGRYVCDRIAAETNGWVDVILDTRTGIMQRFPFPLYYQSWKPDSSAVFVDDKFGNESGKYLVDPLSGKVDDLTKDYGATFGRGMGMTLVAPEWTPDGKYVVFYVTSAQSTAVQTGYVVQPKPFQVKLSKNQIIQRSPLPGWVLLQGEMSFDWLNYDGKTMAPIQGWPNNWTWSRNGRYAAQINGGKMDVFRPQLPPGVGFLK